MTEAKWPGYLLGLKSRSEVAERTLEVRFDKPAGMTFKAGLHTMLNEAGVDDDDIRVEEFTGY
jgi:hypothetical protein